MIKGKKIGLRAVELDDLPLLRDWRNIQLFRKHFREFRELNLPMQKKWYEQIVVDSPNDFMFVIVELESGKPIGTCGLTYINWIIRSGDVSLYIGDQEKYIDDDGLASETLQVLIDYGFNTLNLHKLWTERYEFDERKIKLYEQEFSFQRDGVLRDNCFEDEKYWNSYIFSLIKGE